MLLFGHTGIALGAAALAASALDRRPARKWPLSAFASLSKYVDIRLLVVGSMLPDIIDKPVGQYIFRETFSNGRIYAHTLLFLVVIGAAGLYLYRAFRQKWLLAIAAGTFFHLVLDEMWLNSGTLFWPALGLAFHRVELAGWASNMARELFSIPSVYIPESIGLAVLLWLALTLLFRRDIGFFVKTGRLR